jgi:hypothetical protein
VYDSTLGSAAASIDITGIPTTYAHLRLLLYLRGDNASTTVQGLVRFNNDSAANYQTQYVQGNAAAASAGESLSGTSLGLVTAPAASVGGNVFGGAVVDILSYANSTNQKVVQSAFSYRTGGSTGQGFVGSVTGWWATGAAINRITILASVGNWLAGSRASLYVLGA